MDSPQILDLASIELPRLPREQKNSPYKFFGHRCAGKYVSDAYRAVRRKYVNFIKSGNFKAMLRMIDDSGIHPDHEDPMTGRNGLIKACLTNQYKRAKDFVDVGADVDYETMSGLTPLIACAEKGSIKVAKMILLDPWNR